MSLLDGPVALDTNSSNLRQNSSIMKNQLELVECFKILTWNRCFGLEIRDFFCTQTFSKQKRDHEPFLYTVASSFQGDNDIEHTWANLKSQIHHRGVELL